MPLFPRNTVLRNTVPRSASQRLGPVPLLVLFSGIFFASRLLETETLGEVYQLGPDSQWFEIFANDSLQPGDEIVLQEGTYRKRQPIVLRQRGTADRPIVIRAQEGARVLFDGNAMGRGANSRKNVIFIEGSQHIVIRGLEVQGGSSGFRMQAWQGRQIEHLTIEDCHIHHVGNCAVAANRPGNRYYGIILRRNHIHDTAGVGEGFYLGANQAKAEFVDGIIENNYIHDLLGKGVEQGDGIEIKQGSYGNIIRDNVIHDTNYPAIIVYGTRGKKPNIIERNVIWGCRTHAIQAASDVVIRNNIIFDCRHSGIHSQNHDGAIPGNLQIINNTICSTEAAIHVSSPLGGKLSGPIVIANNALYSRQNIALELPDLPGFRISSNVGIGSSTLALSPGEWNSVGNMEADFMAIGHRNAHLKSGSVLVAAADTEFLPERDFYNQLRGTSADVGACRFRPDESMRDEIKKRLKPLSSN